MRSEEHRALTRRVSSPPASHGVAMIRVTVTYISMDQATDEDSELRVQLTASMMGVQTFWGFFFEGGKSGEASLRGGNARKPLKSERSEHVSPAVSASSISKATSTAYWYYNSIA